MVPPMTIAKLSRWKKMWNSLVLDRIAQIQRPKPISMPTTVETDTLGIGGPPT
jgi:hypothetical protein